MDPGYQLHGKKVTLKQIISNWGYSDGDAVGAEAIAWYCRKYETLRHGRHRIGFRMPDGRILKVAWNKRGMRVNASEASAAFDFPTARVHHFFHFYDTNCLVVEPVAPFSSWSYDDQDKPLPDWAHTIDSAQVGRSLRTGQIVAFDYGR